ncbi:MAG TPA: DUF721 domain-containing protein [Bacillota bacterium]|jgi:predicted nucleic acid-binding Zn ribbon protein|nr:DUF721 domain-containing protein [Bacillota bacterium]HOB87235.1 DUF721 domain-containing protein [Bacillota bacterium]HOP68258.1 DUF721 domain-containing protein [Bacillota bacterium]HPT33128.1 DUF721 domain-containing protein [Bacillota bacterium]HPZ64199.1 DUF721 domain-containing protein [Bacillota bacterium]
MKEIGEIIEQLLKERNMWNRVQEFSLLEAWETIVGERIGSVSRARSISKGILKVEVADSTWVYHLNLLKPRLIKQLNEHAQKKLVKDIIFQIGEVEKQEK